LTTNELVRQKQKQLIEVTTRPTVKAFEGDAAPARSVSIRGPAGPDFSDRERSGNKTIQKVVLPDELEKIKGKDAQDNISNKFCPESTNESQCLSGLRSFGATVAASISAKTDDCKALQKDVSALYGFDIGNADLVPADKLGTVVAYYQACTTPELPEGMRKLIGIIVDLSRPSGKTQSGIAVAGKTYAPIGMAVQISANRIYTARHVLFYLKVENRRFVGARDISQLRYIPLDSPMTLLRLSRETHPTSLDDKLADVPLDQAVISLVDPYAPTNVQWPVVERLDIVLGAKPTPLYVAGFQMTLARASTRGPQNGRVIVPPGKWTEFIRRDATATCTRITQTSDGCMLHGCDTIGGLSGTPIFAKVDGTPNDRPMVIGVHNGSAFNVPSACPAGTMGLPLNIAALPVATLIKD
jgi:hypothetical protein